MIFLITIIGFVVFVIWNKTLDKPGIESTCIDVNNDRGYILDSCFNSKAQIVFLNFKRTNYDPYDLDSINISFFDSSSKDYEFSDIPLKGESKVYQLTATKNPKNMYLKINIKNNLEESRCENPRRIFVRDCEDNNPANDTSNPVKEVQSVDLRVHLLELKDKENSWKNLCSSKWICSQWESCQNGIQKRSCTDSGKCLVSTSVPDTVRYCSQSCIEDWQCSWSKCENNITKPSCNDRNSCGSTNDLPDSISCNTQDSCKPDITCGNWSECTIDYNIMNLENPDLKTLEGDRYRICTDKNNCVKSLRETSQCSNSIDIYTTKYRKCNVDYVDVYNKLDSELIARIDMGNKENPYMNIRLDGGSNQVYCDYCYNGVLDGDETNIDCGGGCISCDKKSGPINLLEDSFFVRISRWFAKLFS